MNIQTPSLRLDKWLWVARLFKTRAICRDHILKGKIHYNGQRSKPSKHVDIGATVSLRQNGRETRLIITKLATKRGNADTARCLYQETQESQYHRETLTQLGTGGEVAMPHPHRRPNKKERRHLIQFKQGK